MQCWHFLVLTNMVVYVDIFLLVQTKADAAGKKK
jgi:hypothetical protein